MDISNEINPCNSESVTGTMIQLCFENPYSNTQMLCSQWFNQGHVLNELGNSWNNVRSARGHAHEIPGRCVESYRQCGSYLRCRGHQTTLAQIEWRYLLYNENIRVEEDFVLLPSIIFQVVRNDKQLRYALWRWQHRFFVCRLCCSSSHLLCCSLGS